MYGPATPEWILMDMACLRIHVLVIRLPQLVVYSPELTDFLVTYRCRVLMIDAIRYANVVEKIQTVFPDACIKSNKLGKSPIYSKLEMVMSIHREGEQDVNITTIDDVNNMASDDVINVTDIQDRINPDDVSFVYPTSGSTGQPKMVTMSHFSMVNTFCVLSKSMIAFNDRLFSWFGSGSHFAAITGCTHVHIAPTFTAASANLPRFMEILAQEKVNIANFPVYLLHDVVSALESGTVKRPPNLVTIITTGEITPRVLRARVIRLGFVHTVSYGSTESCTICVDVATPGAPLAQSEDTMLAMPLNGGTEVKVTDDQGRLVATGEKGMMWVRSRILFSGYLDNKQTTARVLTGSGWLNTGDLAVIDTADQKVTLLGRVSETISKGSLKVDPVSIEAVLKRHPDVQSACVAGIPDYHYGEDIGACVVPKPGSDITEKDLLQFCSSISESPSIISLVPKCIVFVRSLPVLLSGKVDRLRVKSLLQATQH
jgi:fatty-acyl-CoA synthase